jgi:hypothetical protein
VLFGKLGVTSYEVVAPGPAAAVAAVIVTMKIGWTRIATMLTAMTSTRTTGMGGPRDWPCVHPLTASESLYPCKRYCHAFVASPNEAAMLDVLFAPYNKDSGRECTYKERRAIAEEDDVGGGKQRQPLITLVPIDWPDIFDCLGGLYGCFCLD